MNLLKNFLNHIYVDIKLDWKHYWKIVILSFIVFILYYKCHKMNFKQGRSYIDSPDWIKNKKATMNPINKKMK